MAAAFFDLTPAALRAKEQDGQFVSVDKDDLTPTRGIDDKPSKGHKHRRYSLYDIRRLAHAFRAQGKMSDKQLKLIIMRLDSFSEPIFKSKRKNYYRDYRSPSEREAYNLYRSTRNGENDPPNEVNGPTGWCREG